MTNRETRNNINITGSQVGNVTAGGEIKDTKITGKVETPTSENSSQNIFMKIWKDSVWSKVIASAIVGTAAAYNWSSITSWFHQLFQSQQ